MSVERTDLEELIYDALSSYRSARTLTDGEGWSLGDFIHCAHPEAVDHEIHDLAKHLATELAQADESEPSP